MQPTSLPLFFWCCRLLLSKRWVWSTMSWHLYMLNILACLHPQVLHQKRNCFGETWYQSWVDAVEPLLDPGLRMRLLQNDGPQTTKLMDRDSKEKLCMFNLHKQVLKMLLCKFIYRYFWSRVHSTTEIDPNSNSVVQAKFSWGGLFQVYWGLEKVFLKYSTDGPLRKLQFYVQN